MDERNRRDRKCRALTIAAITQPWAVGEAKDLITYGYVDRVDICPYHRCGSYSWQTLAKQSAVSAGLFVRDAYDRIRDAATASFLCALVMLLCAFLCMLRLLQVLRNFRRAVIPPIGKQVISAYNLSLSAAVAGVIATAALPLVYPKRSVRAATQCQ